MRRRRGRHKSVPIGSGPATPLVPGLETASTARSWWHDQSDATGGNSTRTVRDLLERFSGP